MPEIKLIMHSSIQFSLNRSKMINPKKLQGISVSEFGWLDSLKSLHIA